MEYAFLTMSGVPVSTLELVLTSQPLILGALGLLMLLASRAIQVRGGLAPAPSRAVGYRKISADFTPLQSTRPIPSVAHLGNIAARERNAPAEGMYHHA